MANNVDPDQTPHFAVSDLGLHCLLRLVCPNIYSYYCSLKIADFCIALAIFLFLHKNKILLVHVLINPFLAE